MSSDLRDLYQEVILDHGRRPRNFGPLEGANRNSEGHNPLCGDHIEVHATVDADGRIQDVRFEGHGCAISTASASLMTGAVKGKTVSLYNHIILKRVNIIFSFLCIIKNFKSSCWDIIAFHEIFSPNLAGFKLSSHLRWTKNFEV